MFQDTRHQLDSHSTRLSLVVPREIRPHQSESTIQPVTLSDILVHPGLQVNPGLVDHRPHDHLQDTARQNLGRTCLHTVMVPLILTLDNSRHYTTPCQ